MDRKKKPARPPRVRAVLPLRDFVVFPYMIVPLLVGRRHSMEAVSRAVQDGEEVLLLSQKSASVEEPASGDLFRIGTLARIVQTLRLPDGTLKVLAEGLRRERVVGFLSFSPLILARTRPVRSSGKRSLRVEGLVRSATQLFEEYVSLNSRVSPEVLSSVSVIDNAGKLADIVSAHLGLKSEEKQVLLEIASPGERLKELSLVLGREIKILKVEREISGEVRRQVEKNQKSVYLQEQLRAIEKELDREGAHAGEAGELRERVGRGRLPEEVRDKALDEIEKLSKMPPYSPESAVIRNYLDWLLGMPWKSRTRDNMDLAHAERILEEDHYGLKRPKERILEYLAVRKLRGRMRGPVLCLVGPPGVGKTSLGRSVARALGRRFVRVSLGGVRDEAEIRGHRRTYVGALPGRVVQSMRKAGARNPVFLLDEVDKMTADFRGDPSAALLEVLDPEQNHNFSDHYLELDFDLSETLFLTTANAAEMIHPTLRDRMEVIEIPGYTEMDKVRIAERFLLPKQIGEHGLGAGALRISRAALAEIVRSYTREAGVREMERQISRVCRKVARAAAEGGGRGKAKISIRSLPLYLGRRRYPPQIHERGEGAGVATGLAWTEFGGELIKVEAALMDGRGDLILTGMMGDVMQESARAALTFVRTRYAPAKAKKDFSRKIDTHIHVPEGAIPKDGPSAGVAMAVSLLSAVTGKDVDPAYAMTGEITLRGRILPVGGVKEKTLAAHRYKIGHVVLPTENAADLEEIPQSVRSEITFHLVSHMDEVLKLLGFRP